MRVSPEDGFEDIPVLRQAAVKTNAMDAKEIRGDCYVKSTGEECAKIACDARVRAN
jgi:hypothetical protein